MKRKLAAATIVIALLSLPVGYALARDVAIRVMLATHSLPHENVQYSFGSYELHAQGDDEGTQCTVQMTEPQRGGVNPIYPIPCELRFGDDSGNGNAEVLPAITSDEVITVDGVRVWQGEPSGEISFGMTLIYALSYVAALYGSSYLVARRWRTIYTQSDPALATSTAAKAAILYTFVGSVISLFAVMALSVVNVDVMFGMLAGAFVALAIADIIGRVGHHRRPPVD